MNFSTQWLDLREPADRRARNGHVLNAVAALCADRTTISIVDLACGTGSTLRALSTLLPASQGWLLVDHDADLLAEAQLRAQDAGFSVTTREMNLLTDLESVFTPKPGFVTTSAFLDLVSDAWLDRLVALLAKKKLPFYAALTFDGRMHCSPAHPLDERIRQLVLQHQRTDKGFGAALGPDAAQAAVAKFKATGFHIVEGQSDWAFDEDEGIVQSMLVHGWAQAAGEMAKASDMDDGQIADWRDWHLTRIAEGVTRIGVGHVDFLATYPSD